ncbi:MAG: DNA-3-methyladenine glycosylase [Cyclobacteriaceae bacterium]|jgi:DNA-3-methyladenine glycosylase|nr:DNA-3-methyladenine glycosylase [Cyclobacteriaceae bacterium]
MKLPVEYYQNENVTDIARHLVGKRLVTGLNKQLTSGIIVETEAYSYRERGCHAYRGMTPRNEVMFGQGGVAYIYLCYGIHHLFNVVTHRAGYAEAVLIRALEPCAGEDVMMARTGSPLDRITSGPGKLTKAMGLTTALNGIALTANTVWLEDDGWHGQTLARKRIGIDYAGHDAHLPWRFVMKANRWVSR